MYIASYTIIALCMCVYAYTYTVRMYACDLIAISRYVAIHLFTICFVTQLPRNH